MLEKIKNAIENAILNSYDSISETITVTFNLSEDEYNEFIQNTCERLSRHYYWDINGKQLTVTWMDAV